MPSTSPKSVLSAVLVLVVALAASRCLANDVKVTFDIPSKVECHDVTPEKCAAAHPNMKVIEVKFRISTNFVEGEESSAVDVVYMISSPEMRLKVLDFLPNTTLESSTAEDRIEVTDSTESTDAVTDELKVAYSLLSLGASKSISNKKSESNHYQRIASKHLVLASGTVNRGNGVFYKLRPSHELSLEGSKEFAILFMVPKIWRGDWCTVTCSARANKKSTFSSNITIAGIEHAHVGLYLSGDREAAELSEQMTEVQLADNGLLANYLVKDATHTVEVLHSVPSHQELKGPSTEWLSRVVKLKPSTRHTSLETAKGKLVEIEHRMKQLAGPTTTVAARRHHQSE